jgi:hypothetical protein
MFPLLTAALLLAGHGSGEDIGTVVVTEVQPEGRWYRRQARLTVKLTNASKRTVWLNMERPAPRASWEWRSHFFCTENRTGGTCDSSGGIPDYVGDPMVFLRSSDAITLAPGQSATWKGKVGPIQLRPGRASLEVRSLLLGTRDRAATKPEVYEVAAKLELVLVRRGACFEARRR